MVRKLILTMVLLAGAGLALRQYVIYSRWEPLHAAEFASDDCALYHVMRGLEQDPTKDPANAQLVQKCGPDYIPWSLSQSGDLLRFDRPAWIRLRFDPIDPKGRTDLPPMMVEFPYPAVVFPESFRVRQWGSPFAASEETSARLLKPGWSPPWAELFAKWSLGRGNHEVWLGGAAIDDPKYCESVEHDDQRAEDFCVMTVFNVATQQPVRLRLPLATRLEIRLEMLDICRFGGHVRRWDNALLQTVFGEFEYTDRGCSKF